MEGHEDTQVPPAAPATPLSEDQIAVANHAAKIAVDLLEPIIMKVSDGLRLLESELGSRVDVLEQTAGPTDESRLDSLEAKIKNFGLGGETVGDALALASFALATARTIAAAVERGTGMTIPLPPAPDRIAEPLPEATVKGAELASAM